MAVLKKLIIFILPVITLTGCMEEFDLDINEKRVLCMNSDLVAGDSIHMYLSHSWFYTDGIPEDGYDVTVKNAKIEIYVNGEYRDTMRPALFPNRDLTSPWIPTEYGYTADYIPQSGDTILFKAYSDEWGDAEAEVVMPYPVAIDKVEMEISSFSWGKSSVYDHEGNYIGEEEEYKFNLNGTKIWFTDNAGQDDLYMLSDERHYYLPPYGENGARAFGNVIYRTDYSDPIFTEHISVIEDTFLTQGGYTFFSDKQISGKSYPLKMNLYDITYSYLNPENKPEADSCGIELQLNHITKAYYNHLLSVWTANDGLAGTLGEAGLGEPVYSYSNVSTGAGIISASARSSFFINLHDLVKEYLAAHPEAAE